MNDRNALRAMLETATGHVRDAILRELGELPTPPRKRRRSPRQSEWHGWHCYCLECSR